MQPDIRGIAVDESCLSDIVEQDQLVACVDPGMRVQGSGGTAGGDVFDITGSRIDAKDWGLASDLETLDKDYGEEQVDL